MVYFRSKRVQSFIAMHNFSDKRNHSIYFADLSWVGWVRDGVQNSPSERVWFEEFRITKQSTRILMKQTNLASKSELVAGRFRPPGSIWTHSYSGLHKAPPHHPPVREHKQGEGLRRVVLQSTVAKLGMTKLALDNPKRVLHRGADTGFELFDSIRYGAQLNLFMQCLTFARSHWNMPSGVDVLDFFALGYALVTSISIDVSLIPLRECMRLGYVVDVGGCSNYRVYKARVGISADVRLHSTVPLIALLGLMHFRVTLARAVLGRAGRGDDGGID